MRTTLILAILVLLATPLLADGTPDGAAIYKSKCAMCHGPDGAGQTPVGKSLKVTSLGSPEVQKQSDADLIKAITNGKGKMPPFNGKLTAEEIKTVVGFVRTLKK